MESGVSGNAEILNTDHFSTRRHVICRCEDNPLRVNGIWCHRRECPNTDHQ